MFQTLSDVLAWFGRMPNANPKAMIIEAQQHIPLSTKSVSLKAERSQKYVISFSCTSSSNIHSKCFRSSLPLHYAWHTLWVWHSNWPHFEMASYWTLSRHQPHSQPSYSPQRHLNPIPLSMIFKFNHNGTCHSVHAKN
jgi:hypothetical protein